MRFLWRLFLWLLFLLPVGIAALFWLSFSALPLVAETPKLSHQDIARAEAIVRQNDPRKLAAGAERRVVLREQDINLAGNYVLQRAGQGRVQVALRENFMDVAGTLHLSLLPGREYVNLSLRVEAVDGKPSVSDFKLGAVPVPAFIVRAMMRELMARVLQTQDYKLATQVIKQLDLQPGRLSVTYQWLPELIGEMGHRLAGASDPAALAAYHQYLLDLQAQGRTRRGSVSDLLKPMFAFAQQRSINSDPVAENRALLLVLGAWASEQNTQLLVPHAPQPRAFALSLEQRQDFGQHFLVSAAIAASADVLLSNMVGVNKEVSDAQGGSGFSFTDIAADRAGTRFGELATASAESARRVQGLMSAGMRETGFIPLLRDLPEGMQASEFKRRYGSVDAPAYRVVMQEIERRIAACSLYRS